VNMHYPDPESLDEAWDCPTCGRPTPPSQDVECHCGMLVSHHVPATELCKRLRAAQQREASLIVENKRLKALLEEKEEFIQRVITWPHDADPFFSMDHDNDTETYSCRN
jgi:hypothetical protein